MAQQPLVRLERQSWPSVEASSRSPRATCARITTKVLRRSLETTPGISCEAPICLGFVCFIPLFGGLALVRRRRLPHASIDMYSICREAVIRTQTYFDECKGPAGSPGPKGEVYQPAVGERRDSVTVLPMAALGKRAVVRASPPPGVGNVQCSDCLNRARDTGMGRTPVERPQGFGRAQVPRDLREGCPLSANTPGHATRVAPAVLRQHHCEYDSRPATAAANPDPPQVRRTDRVVSVGAVAGSHEVTMSRRACGNDMLD